MTAQDQYVHGMERLIAAISDLAHAGDEHGVREIVRSAAREMTGVDDATFMLADDQSSRRFATDAYEMKLLRALADSASVALHSIRMHEELEARVRDRTQQLEAANAELEAFSYTASHDLRGPVRAINGFSALLLQNPKVAAEDESRFCLQQIQRAAHRMEVLISDLLDLAHVSRLSPERECVSLSDLAHEILHELRSRTPERTVRAVIAENVRARCDRRLVRIVLDNLLGNAWKFTNREPQPVIQFGADASVGVETVYFVRDNGAGFDMSRADRLFAPFERLHTQSEFPGSGVGLATVKRAIDRHTGALWATSQIGCGSAFYFTLGPAESSAMQLPEIADLGCVAR